MIVLHTMSKRILIVLVALLMVSVSYVMAGNRDTLHTTYVVNSDYVPIHEYKISVGGGLHTLLPHLSAEGQSRFGLNTGVGAGAQVQASYTYFFHKYVGVTAGLGFELYTGNMNGSFSDTVYLYDNYNKMYYYLNCDYHDFRESQQLYMLTIPVGVTGRLNVSDPLQLRGSVGLGMNVIVGSNFQARGEVTTSGDYPDYLLHIDPDLPQHGFTNYYLGAYRGKIENTFPVNMFVFADLGIHYQFTRHYGLYAGVYFEYSCFNAIRPTTNDAGNRPELITFNTRTKQLTYSGIVNSKFIDAMNPLAVGVKVGFTFSMLDPIKCNCENW